MNIEAKSLFLIENGIENTAFVWESKEFDYFWNVILQFYKRQIFAQDRESLLKMPNIFERIYFSFVYRFVLDLIKLP